MGITSFVMGTNWVTMQSSIWFQGPAVSVAGTVGAVRIPRGPGIICWGRAVASPSGAFVRIRKRHCLWAHNPCEQSPGCILAPTQLHLLFLGALEQCTTLITVLAYKGGGL